MSIKLTEKVPNSYSDVAQMGSILIGFFPIVSIIITLGLWILRTQMNQLYSLHCQLQADRCAALEACQVRKLMPSYLSDSRGQARSVMKYRGGCKIRVTKNNFLNTPHKGEVSICAAIGEHSSCALVFQNSENRWKARWAQRERGSQSP